VYHFFLVFTFSSITKAKSGLPKYWEKVVVMIEKEVQNNDGSIDTVPHGTGFLFNDSIMGTFLVTNRHILKGRNLIFIRFNKLDFDPKKDKVRYYREPCLLIGEDSKPLWKGHPNPNIDVAIAKFNKPTVEVDARLLDYSRLKSFDSLEVGEDVYFFGYPLGVFGLKGKGDFPILRSGVISYKSFEPTFIGNNFIDSSMFLVDGFSFAGNSGSPVLTKVTNVKAMLVGIIVGHMLTFQQNIVGQDSFFVQSTGDTVFFKAHPDTITFEQNTGLALVISADRIKETLEQFKMK
jgi:hypothetical protein